MKILFWVLCIISIFVILLGFYSIGTSIIVRYTGTKVKAKVIKVQERCGKYNHINLQVNDIVYEISISRQNCVDKLYKVSDEVVVIKRGKNIAWPNSHPELLIPLLGIVFFGAYYTNKDKYKKWKKDKNPK